MKIFVSEIDRQNARNVALKNLARHFNIVDWEFKSNDDLMQDLRNLNNPDSIRILRLLDEYFVAYDAWFNFYQERRAVEARQEMDYDLNAFEQRELQGLITRREATLEALQQDFDRLQLQRFNREQFGEDIDGIVN